MKAKNVWMIFAILAIAMLFFACGQITTPDPPDPPPPDESKYYDLEVEYIRTEILNPAEASFIPGVLLINSGQLIDTQFFSRIMDDYHFKCEFTHIKGGVNNYYFSMVDRARYDGSDYSSVMVGDIYKVKVKQTGVTTELKDVRPYTLATNPNPGPKAKYALFQLLSDGTIISNAQ